MEATPEQVHLVMVHYRCEEELARALASVAADAGRGPLAERLRTWVVDNGATPGKEPAAGGLPLDPVILRPGENLGFGRACNLALERIEAGTVIFLNPDTRILPGTLAALLAPLASRRVGAVGSRLYLDDDLRFTVSEPLDLTPFLPCRARLKERAPWLGLERRELVRRHRFVTGKEPRKTNMLCGACMALRRETLAEVGGFHPGFFMYFEDQDLLRKIRRAGYRLVHNPAARVVHYYDRSARQAGADKEKWIGDSHRLFLGRNFGPLQRGAAVLAGRVAARLPARPRGGEIVQDRAEPSLLRLNAKAPWEPPWFFEFSEGPNYDITACTLVKGPSWRLPGPVWEDLVPKRYWTRLSRPDLGGPIFHGVMEKGPS